MPDWANYSYSCGTSSSFSWVALSEEEVQQQYLDYQQERERQDAIIEQMLQEEAERLEEREKYPLFFWRETCKPV